jgi:hypothetical protein
VNEYGASRTTPRGNSIAVASPSRGAVDVRPAGERQPEHPRHLVERLARRVVDRLPERLDGSRDRWHDEQRRVTARDEQRDARFRQVAVREPIHRDVRGEMVDAVQRFAHRDRIRLRRRDADQQRAGQSRTRGDGDCVDVGPLDPRIGERPVHRRLHRFEMRAAGDFRYDAAEACVLLDARRECVGEQLRAAHDADAGLVARRLDAEYERRGHGVRSRRITTASVPLGW